MEMKKKNLVWALATVLLLAMASCHKDHKYANCPLVGHWGCEQYVSCRIKSDGTEKWDTLNYTVGPGYGYEVFFYDDGSGKLWLNESPAMFKKFNCNYDFDSVTDVLTIYNTSWILTQFSDVTSADMDIEYISADSIVSSWINHFSEPEPFFERFFIKRIE